MKPILLMSFIVALPAFAGTSAKQAIAPPSNPCLMSWFAGASVGYLTELEEPMYNVHFGVTNSCWMLGGWNVSAFAEVGYTETELLNFIDITAMPVTGNVKFERALSGNLNAYVGAGVGMTWIDVDFGPLNSSDWTFTTQVFAGLSYSVTPACEIYGGARWIYLSDANLFDTNIELDNDWLLELGVRYKF